MADNVTITQNANSTPPAGTVIATDDVNGVQYQIMKLATGADGEATLVSSSAPIPISIDVEQSTVDGKETHSLLSEILEQLKIVALLLNIMNDSDITIEDV